MQHEDGTDEEASLGTPKLDPCINNLKSSSDNDDLEKTSKVVQLLPKDAEQNRRKRFLEKDGTSNIQYKNISKKNRIFLRDLFTTLMDAGWIEIIVLFHLSFYLTWLFFAVIYYTISYFHGDLELDHLPSRQQETGWVPCIAKVEDFTTMFLYSLETQHSIGYGSREITPECPIAMTVMSIQSIFGTLIEAFMVGLVFCKLMKPKQRSKTVVFSSNAVICTRDRKLCLMLRVGDMRHESSLVGAEISVNLVQRKVTQEGEIYDDVTPLQVRPDSSEKSTAVIIWPITLVHVIDQSSPFYKHGPQEIASSNFEIHVAMEGTIESTGLTFQARTSYVPSEILWGHRFESLMIYRHDMKKYQVNFAAFDSSFEVDTPKMSAFEISKSDESKTFLEYTDDGDKLEVRPDEQ